MKVVLCHAFGEPDGLRVEEFEPLDLEKGQVRICVRAAGVNFPDYLMVTGKYQVTPPLPFTPGIEAAGERTSELAMMPATQARCRPIWHPAGASPSPEFCSPRPFGLDRW